MPLMKAKCQCGHQYGVHTMGMSGPCSYVSACGCQGFEDETLGPGVLMHALDSHSTWCGIPVTGVSVPVKYTGSWDDTTCLACLDVGAIKGSWYAKEVAERLRRKIGASSVPDIEGEVWDD